METELKIKKLIHFDTAKEACLTSYNFRSRQRPRALMSAVSTPRCTHWVLTAHTLISQQKNRTWPIREQRERHREIRNPIQWRALFHCKCGRGHSQFQKEQVLYIRVWRDGRPSCSLSYEAHARAGTQVINMDPVEIPAELNCHLWWLTEHRQHNMQSQARGFHPSLLLQ